MKLISRTMLFVAAVIIGQLALPAEADCIDGVTAQSNFKKLKFLRSFPYVVTKATEPVSYYQGCNIVKAYYHGDDEFTFALFKNWTQVDADKPVYYVMRNVTGEGKCNGRSVFDKNSDKKFDVTIIMTDYKTFYVSYWCIDGTPRTMLTTEEGEVTANIAKSIATKKKALPRKLRKLVNQMNTLGNLCQKDEEDEVCDE